MATMEETVNGPEGGEQQQVVEGQQGEQQENPGEGQGTGAAGAPPAPHTEGLVPRKALEEERKGRQDWKEKAIRAEAERDELRRRVDGGQAQVQQRELDPVEVHASRIENVLLNASERAARKEYGTETVDKAFARFEEEVRKNPALGEQVRFSADPWDELVKAGQRLIAMDEIGTDPAAYRKRIEDEVRATFQPKQPEPVIPASLADARSAGSRGTVWTGPTPFDAILKK